VKGERGLKVNVTVFAPLFIGFGEDVKNKLNLALVGFKKTNALQNR
jgi:hypothetical protein